jgi:hypothetical protein
MADIRITPAASVMAFTSSLNYKETLTQEASGSLTLLGSGSTGRTDIFSVDGNNGRLFSVSDDLSNSLFSVNTIAGLPVIEAFADNTVVMGQYGQNVLVVTGSRVGIGTATPQGKLAVDGGNFRFNYGNAATAYYLYLNHNSGQDGGMLWTRDNSTFDWQINNLAANGDLSFYAYGAGSQVVTFKRSNGYVGIGTTSPSYKLHTVNEAFIGNSGGTTGLLLSGDTNSRIDFRSGSASTGQITCGNSSNLFIDAFDSRAIELALAGTTVLEVSNTANVGIGTLGSVEPSALLEVKSNTQGFLPPRMDEGERDAIAAPALGLMIYNTSTNEVNVFTGGGGWRRIQYV